jgi:hypothetical protein
MKIVAALVLFVISTNACSETETNHAYLIIYASVEGEKSKPTWISLATRKKFRHHATSEAIAILEPGVWNISHVHLTEKPSFRWGQRDLSRNLSLKLEAGKIYYLGTLQLQSKVGIVNDYRFVSDASLMRRACKEHPEVFEKYPLVMLLSPNQSERFVACKGS